MPSVRVHCKHVSSREQATRERCEHLHATTREWKQCHAACMWIWTCMRTASIHVDLDLHEASVAGSIVQ